MKKRVSIMELIAAILCCLLLNFIFITSNNKTILAQAVTVSELYNSSTGKFNDTNIKTLVRNLFGTEPNGKTLDRSKWVNYINTNGVNDSGSIVLDASKIRQKAGGDIEVMLGGIQWWATSMTVSTNNEAILTLYAKNDHATTSKFWSTDSHGGFSTRYEKMYASSILRNNLLNGSTYAAAYGLFRNGSFATKYLVTPKNIPYQKYQTIVGRSDLRGFGFKHSPNEAYGSTKFGGDSFVWDGNSTFNISDTFANNSGVQCRYDAWQNDYIWIPSASETGFSNYMQTTSIWKLNSTQLSHSSKPQTWLRSGRQDLYSALFYLESDGVFSENPPSCDYGVRPAIHFNLSNLMLFEGETDKTEDTYTGEPIDFTFCNFDADKVELTSVIGKKLDGTTVISTISTADFLDNIFKPTLAGTYDLTFNLKTEAKTNGYAWIDAIGGQGERTVTVVVRKKQFIVPTASEAKTYNGSKQDFTLNNFYSGGMGVVGVAHTSNNGTTILTANASRTEFSSGSIALVYNELGSLSVKDAGIYTTTIALKDKDNCEWEGATIADITFMITMNPKELKYYFIFPISSMNVPFGTEGDITVSYVSGQEPIMGDEPKLIMYYTTSDNTKHKVNANSEIITNLKLDLTTFTTVGTYTLSLDEMSDNDNYVVKSTPESGGTLTIIPALAGLETYLLQYSDGLGTYAMLSMENKLQYKLNAAGNAGVQYTVTLETSEFPSYLSVDTSYNQNGFVNGYKNNIATNVGIYSMQARLHSNNSSFLFSDGTQDEDITLSYQIDKGTLDFTGTKWQYNISGSTTYSNYAQWNGNAWEYLDKSSEVIEADNGLQWTNSVYELTMTNLPKGVTVNNSLYAAECKKKNIGSFVAELPLAGLNFDRANFNEPNHNILKLNWKIVQAVVEIVNESWTFTTHGTTPNTFQIPTLNGVSAVFLDGVVYEYYDLGTGNSPIAPPGNRLLGVSAIIYTSGVTHNYYVKAAVKNGKHDSGVPWSSLIRIEDKTGGDNYNGNSLGEGTKFFEIGDNKTIVNVNLTYHTIAYAKEVQPANIEITSGGLTVTDLVITYELNGVSLVQEPKNAGVYTVNIALDSSLLDNYVLTGTTLFTYTITPIVYDFTGTKWDYDGATPYKFEYDGTKAVEYKPRLVYPDNMPQEVAYAITALESTIYSGDSSASTVGNYSVTANLSALNSYTDNDFLMSNFDLRAIPSAMSLSYKVESLELDKPTFDGSFTIYDGAMHDIALACGLPDNWSNYLEVKAKLTQPNGTVIDNYTADNKSYMAKDVGEYEFTFTIKSDINSSASGAYNVRLGDDITQKVKFNVEPRIIATATPITLPIFKGGVKYTGSDITIKAENITEYFDGFDGTKMTIKDSTGKKAGTYSIVFGIKDTALHKWDTSNENEVEVTWEIEKTKITLKWTTVNGKSVIVLPNEYIEHDLFDYIYTKADGTIVNDEELVKGETYNVVAKLKEEYRENIDFVDESGVIIENETSPESFIYNYNQSFLDKLIAFMITPIFCSLPGWVWTCIIIFDLIITIIILKLLLPHRNSYDEYYYEDSEEYYDDEIGNDDDTTISPSV